MVDSKTVELRHGTCTMTKRDINGNTYVVAFYDGHPDFGVDGMVIVYCDKLAGADRGLVDWPTDLRQKYDKIYVKKFRYQRDGPAEKIVSRTVNESIAIVEGKQEHVQDMEDRVLAALEANKEVYEDIDYELEKLI